MRTKALAPRAATCAGTALLALAAGCASQAIGLRPIDPQAGYRETVTSALWTNEPSNPTRIVLRRTDLSEVYENDPIEALEALRQRMVSGVGGRNELYALAELSFLEGERALVEPPRRWTARPAGDQYDLESRPNRSPEARARSRAQFLAAAVYAYAYLFPEVAMEEMSVVDPRTRVAADLYNRAVAQAFSLDDGRIGLRSGTYPTPLGALEVAFDATDLDWGDYTLVDVIPLEDLAIYGLTNHYRRPGLGAPIGAHTSPRNESVTKTDLVSPDVMVPGTLVLTLDAPVATVVAGGGTARLRLVKASDQQSISIGGREVPLEVEPSATLAGTLQQARYWDDQIALFLGKMMLPDRKSQLFAARPHQRGRVPIVFVHGTNSHPAVWANMVNDLTSDARLRGSYEAWFFRYDSGNPILYSSMKLRRALTEAVDQIDPEGKDRCLRSMVVIGHSQGGLLTKMTAVSSGNRFWETISDRPFEQVSMSEKNRALLREGMFIEPLPFVKRVIFISTPHRGSFLAGPQLVRRLMARLIRLPSEMVGLTGVVANLRGSSPDNLELGRMATSIDNMSPGHPFIKTSASLPIAPGIAANSIIPVKPGDEIETGDDGVVKYQSAHIEGVESELVVRDYHSTQSNPNTVEEVRRILLEHAALTHCSVEP